MIKLKDKRTTFSNLSRIWMVTFFIFVLFFASSPVLAQYKTGSPVPDFTLKTLDEEVYQLNQFSNKQQHLILCFVHSNESSSIAKLEEMVNFFNDYQPRESYQIIAIIHQDKLIEVIQERLFNLKEKTEIPLIILLDVDGKANASYEIESYPTILLLRSDLYVRKVYDRFTTRQKASFYQYLKFIFTSKKINDNSSGCDGGVCPPPPGSE